MTTSDGNVSVMLNVLWSYATNDEDRMMCHTMVAQMREDGETSDKIVENLAGALIDGLRLGNWPWVVARMEHLDTWATKNHPRPMKHTKPRIGLDGPEEHDPFGGNGTS